ncbi:hypothetical protein K461DRAFT_267429 [Myriangium duriaei CBS 260.36]|uniref:Uncharacterized protein n=1 Tax=Myriangium duriaei CBS 260.36 TaxID=1168546 RepID=A0A9P4J6L9_9PEZI|nr:hypothetical protein K461DRAFT_267429 [Myriangium duriaei CBS 260.36]
MAAIPINLSLTDPQVIHSDDDGEERVFLQILQDLVNCQKDPAKAAQEITTIIVDDCEKSFAKWSDPSTRTFDTDGHPDVSIAYGWQHMLWHALRQIGEVVPADHPGQHSLVSFLAELQQQPDHKLKGVEIYDKYDYDYELCWKKDYDRFYAWLSKLVAVFFHPSDTASFAKRQRYLNFSAFLARLLASGVMDTDGISPLSNGYFDINPFRASDGNLKLELDVDLYESQVEAVAIWIDLAGTVTYDMCKRGYDVESKSCKGAVWTWNRAKERLKSVARAEGKLSQKTCETARQTLEIMKKIEQEYSATSAGDKLGLCFTAEEQREWYWELEDEDY